MYPEARYNGVVDISAAVSDLGMHTARAHHVDPEGNTMGGQQNSTRYPPSALGLEQETGIHTYPKGLHVPQKETT